MGGPGFASGLAQGLQSGQQRMIQLQQLRMQQDFFKSQQKQMEAEDKMAQLKLQELQNKLMFQERLPSAMAGIAGPQAAPLGPRAQGPTLEGRDSTINPQQVASLLMQAQANGADPNQLLDFMTLMDPTGQIQGLKEQLGDPFIKLNEGQSLFEKVRPGQRPKKPKAAQPAQPQNAEVRELTQKMIAEVDKRLDDNDHRRRFAKSEEELKGLIAENEQLVSAKTELTAQLAQQAVQPTPTDEPTPNEDITLQSGTRLRKVTGPGPKAPKPMTAEEAKIAAELIALDPSKVEAFRAVNGRDPSFEELKQLYPASALPEALIKKEDRLQQHRIDVARQTGVEAQERAFELEMQKRKAPNKASDTERKELADDLRAIESLMRLPDEFSPDFVGPWQGRIGNVKEFFGTLEGDEARFRGIVANVRNRVIKAITGAQMGEAEATRIRQELPEFHLSPEAFKARVQLSLENLYMMARIRRDVMGQTGVDLSDLEPLPVLPDIDTRPKRKITLKTGIEVDVPGINQRLQNDGGIGPVGEALEKHRQAQRKFNEQEFLKSLPDKQRKAYQQLEPGDKVRFRDMLFKKADSMLSVGGP